MFGQTEYRIMQFSTVHDKHVQATLELSYHIMKRGMTTQGGGVKYPSTVNTIFKRMKKVKNHTDFRKTCLDFIKWLGFHILLVFGDISMI